MNKEWEPGQVAMVSWAYDGRGATEPAVRRSKGWDALDDATGFLADLDVYRATPLVLIDPESEDDLRAIAELLVAADRGYDDESWMDLRDALREFANPKPPKPEEPTGLGAVVEDDKGVLWIRADGDRMPWLNSESSGDYWQAYEAIDVARVLSSGVQP